MIIKPDYNVKTLFNIDIEALKREGIELLLFDLDSTIMESKSCRYREDVYNWLCKLKSSFKIAVLSNNENEDYISKVKELSCFDVIGSAHKPSRKVAIKYLEEVGISAEKTVVIGDRPLTDILLGKRLGARTVLVDSLTYETESKIVRFVRALERIFIKK